jgi:hypothetical protein
MGISVSESQTARMMYQSRLDHDFSTLNSKKAVAPASNRNKSSHKENKQ